MALIHLIYVSTATRLMTDEELDALLAQSRRANDSRGLTGLLLYADGTFMQVLEGEEAAVDALMEKVGRDPRHHCITELDRRPIAERSFGSWSMGYRRLTRADLAGHPGYVALMAQGVDATQALARPGLAWELLQDFARLAR